jgi:hypothetical protein
MTIKDKFLSKPISELDLSGCEVRIAAGAAAAPVPEQQIR